MDLVRPPHRNCHCTGIATAPGMQVRDRECSKTYVAFEENGDLMVKEEASSVSNGDLLNAVNAFAAEYGTSNRDLLQKINISICPKRNKPRFYRRSMERLTSGHPHVVMGPQRTI